MNTRKIGSLEVTVVGVGCNNFGGRIDADQTAAVVHAALDQGITTFDTADVYGGGQSEELLGRALGSRRDEVVIATKFGAQGGASAANVARSADASLRRLGVDCIDLYQLHGPDQATPIEETLGALDELVKAGKVREIGCSNFSSAMIRAADDAARANGTARFVTVQNHYSLLERRPEKNVIPACEELGLAVLPYFPLANGVLTGKYRRGEPPPEGTRLAGAGDRAGALLTDEHFDAVDRLTEWAAAKGHSIGELAIAWLASQPVMGSVIAGATKPEQVKANAAAGGWELTAAEIDEVRGLLG